jgi:hypothetical protein
VQGLPLQVLDQTGVLKRSARVAGDGLRYLELLGTKDRAAQTVGDDYRAEDALLAMQPRNHGVFDTKEGQVVTKGRIGSPFG